MACRGEEHLSVFEFVVYLGCSAVLSDFFASAQFLVFWLCRQPPLKRRLFLLLNLPLFVDFNEPVRAEKRRRNEH